MSEKDIEDQLPKAEKSSFGTILSTSIYAATVLMILAYLYQSFALHFFPGWGEGDK